MTALVGRDHPEAVPQALGERIPQPRVETGRVHEQQWRTVPVPIDVVQPHTRALDEAALWYGAAFPILRAPAHLHLRGHQSPADGCRPGSGAACSPRESGRPVSSRQWLWARVCIMKTDCSAVHWPWASWVWLIASLVSFRPKSGFSAIFFASVSVKRRSSSRGTTWLTIPSRQASWALSQSLV